MKVVEFSELSVYPQFCEANQRYVEVEESLKNSMRTSSHTKDCKNDLKGQFTSMELLLSAEKVMEDEKATGNQIPQMTHRDLIIVLEITLQQLDLNKQIQKHEEQPPKTDEEICLL
ncbi:hypothetical protein CCACVL1_22212 [Corchorus capsularis]|uniref:Uncharacterized protein n=1 Tax=Corchorus capsularis TaxID=210143 RepID=A0A1R3H0R9_COCAP|nr:hypothetical protein CCACVL1_22212 [Corchorus capsularis]